MSEPAETIGGEYNLSNLAYKAVSEMIRNRRLRSGEVIIEAKLADVLGISRTPLREALQLPEGEALVVKTPNRYFVVRNVDLGEYLQSLKTRRCWRRKRRRWPPSIQARSSPIVMSGTAATRARIASW
jgi:DNA-binding GntR family transcriptional regulator